MAKTSDTKRQLLSRKMQVRILTCHDKFMNTIQLQHFLDNVGNMVHCMNTITVSLSIMPDNDIVIPCGLDISWKSTNVERAKKYSKNVACRSCYVYVAESLYDYLDNISKNIFWGYENINFNSLQKTEKSKAICVYKFLKSIPGIDKEMAILSELLCHWRNKVVHGESSNASLSNKQIDLLKVKRDYLYDNLHHFDVLIALENYKEQKVTLKDVSTLTTIAINCCKKVDEYYFLGVNSIDDISLFANQFNENEVFRKIASHQS